MSDVRYEALQLRMENLCGNPQNLNEHHEKLDDDGDDVVPHSYGDEPSCSIDLIFKYFMFS